MNKSLNFTIFGLFLKKPCFLFSGSYQGHPAPWMDAIGGEVTLWQQMLERPNFWVEGSVPLRTAEKLAMGNA